MRNILLAGAALLLVSAAPAFATDGDVTQSNTATVSLSGTSSATASGTGAEATSGDVSNEAYISQKNVNLSDCGCTGTVDQRNSVSATLSGSSTASATGGLFGGGTATSGNITNKVGIRQKNFSWRH